MAEWLQKRSVAIVLVLLAPLLLLGGYLGVAAAVLWGVPRDVAPEPAASTEPAEA